MPPQDDYNRYYAWVRNKPVWVKAGIPSAAGMTLGFLYTYLATLLPHIYEIAAYGALCLGMLVGAFFMLRWVRRDQERMKAELIEQMRKLHGP